MVFNLEVVGPERGATVTEIPSICCIVIVLIQTVKYSNVQCEIRDEKLAEAGDSWSWLISY